MLMEQEQKPDTTNVVYLDEYPHIEERLRLKRMGQLVLFESDMGNTVLTLFEMPEGSPPDGAAWLPRVQPGSSRRVGIWQAVSASEKCRASSHLWRADWYAPWRYVYFWWSNGPVSPRHWAWWCWLSGDCLMCGDNGCVFTIGHTIPHSWTYTKWLFTSVQIIMDPQNNLGNVGNAELN